MLLIDASNIKMGGGLELLKLLIYKIEELQIDYKVILNPKVHALANNRENVIYENVGIFNRRKIYKKILKRYSFENILCFGNFPPPMKIKGVTTYTYLHGPGLIERSVINRTLWSRFYIFITSLYLDLLKYNTDFFILQTDLVRRIFLSRYNVPNNKCLLYPIYDSENLKQSLKKHVNKIKAKEPNFVYVSLYYPHKNHLNLLKAWDFLREENELTPPKLILTVQKDHPFSEEIENYKKTGVNVENLGLISQEACFKLFAENKYSIFPSLKETFGLGLVEAQLMGSKVLAANLPYATELIEPSLTFDPNSIDDIVKKVKEACLDIEIDETKLKIENKLGDFVKLFE